MKVIIAGSRGLRVSSASISLCLAALYGVASITEIVSGGCANSPDADGEEWAKEYGVTLTCFPARWDKLGRRAGPMRNAEMADYAHAAVVFWDGKSPGSRNMFEAMVKRGKPCLVLAR